MASAQRLCATMYGTGQIFLDPAASTGSLLPPVRNPLGKPPRGGYSEGALETAQTTVARKPGKIKKPGRRWWQRLLRVAIMLALALGAAYVSIPWWVPPSVVQTFLEADLSRQLG